MPAPPRGVAGAPGSGSSGAGGYPPQRVNTGSFVALRRDPALVDASTEGELLVARIRLLLLCLLLPTQLFPGTNPNAALAALGTNVVALVYALAVYLLASYRFRPGLAFVSSAIDVSLVSLGLLGFLVLGQPLSAVNSRVVFDLYFLAIGCASLRYDWRVCALTGALAAGEYLGVVVLSFVAYDRSAPLAAEVPFGWNVQLGRLVALVGAALLSVLGVARAQQLRRLSTTDRLTGIANRGLFDQRLAEEESRAGRYQRPFSVALVDVDRFKRFNDTHGHVAGDLALQALAETLRRSVRRSDLVARYGGEEFALILPETELGEAASKLDVVRRVVAATEIELDGGVLVRIDVSAGVASFPRDGADARSVLAAADSRLYQAKRAGRGRVISGEPRFST